VRDRQSWLRSSKHEIAISEIRWNGRFALQKSRVVGPATKSFTVLETNTSPAPASDATRPPDVNGYAANILTMDFALARV
jgi:hypothetical protein